MSNENMNAQNADNTQDCKCGSAKAGKEKVNKSSSGWMKKTAYGLAAVGGLAGAAGVGYWAWKKFAQ